MKEMSISRQRSRDLVSAYEHSLEHQILGKGSSLVCQDEELRTQVEGMLMDGDARDMHQLGLEPLKVMEESLKAVAASASAPVANVRRGKSNRGLQGLAKAFEVMEQAALNLYLGPWREEYKTVKMYSGTFTHYIKPVLSMPQIEKLFGLMGYQLSSPRHEQLRLQSARVGSTSLDDFLRLSCAFFLARCECHLLHCALEKYAGNAQWELNMVTERQRGNSLQVALDNTKKKLEVNQPPFGSEQEVDLYTDEQVNGGPREAALGDDGPRSLAWVGPNAALPPPSSSTSTAKSHSNGLTFMSSLSAALPAKEPVHTSTLNYHITKSSALQSDPARGSGSVKLAKHPCEESPFDAADPESHSLQAEPTGLLQRATGASRPCSCLDTAGGCVQHCMHCNVSHSITCAFHGRCNRLGHQLEYTNLLGEEPELRAGSPTLRVGASQSLSGSSSSAAMSSSVLHDDPRAMTQHPRPISYHECCNLAQLNPQVLCESCRVFHSGSCMEKDRCQAHHDTKPLGVCSCGRKCARGPLVLCRYCGAEFCKDCWYRSPLECTCGQTFDQSSSV